MNQKYKVLESDVLVIGGGLAGLWAAIRANDFAEKVMLVEKAKVARSSVSMFCHAYGAPMPEDIHDALMKETVERSGYLGDQSWFEIFIKETEDRVRDMEEFGVMFEKEEKGNFKLDAIRGQKIKCSALAEGKQVIETMRAEALKRGTQFVERVAVFELLTSDGNYPSQGDIIGAVGIHTRTGEVFVFKSKAVVIASGSVSAKLGAHYMDNVTGDGYAMAFRAGAEIGGMEFSPNFAFSVWNRKFITGGQGQFQYGGAKLVNRLDEEFLHNYPTASKEGVWLKGAEDFGDLCRAITVENIEGRGPVYFDLRGWSEEKIGRLRKILPFTMMAFDEASVNIKEQLVETTPMTLTYGTGCQSGIRINTLGESTLGGLYAAGASAMYGEGPLPQALCMIGGYRAGEYAAKWSLHTELADINREQVEALNQTIFLPFQRKEGITPRQLYDTANKVLTSFGAGLFKHEKRIKKVLAEIRRVAKEELPKIKADDIHELIKANEARNFILLMELYNIAALERKESRMAHYREDYPYTDDRNWRKWILLKDGGKGGVHLKIEPIPLGRYAIIPRSLSKKPSPIQYKLGKIKTVFGEE